MHTEQPTQLSVVCLTSEHLDISASDGDRPDSSLRTRQSVSVGTLPPVSWAETKIGITSSSRPTATDMGERSTERTERNRQIPRTRRSLLTGIATVATVGTAGCAGVINSIADAALKEVNIFNETTKRVSGTIDIVGPDGASVLTKNFDLQAKAKNEPTEGETVAYGHVWQVAGTYEVSVELTNGTAIRGESSATRSVSINTPDEQMLAVAFGAEGEDAGIYVAVAKNFTGFQ